MRNQTPLRLLAITGASLAAAGLVAVSAGCASDSKPTTRPMSMTDQALSDPYNFNPNVSQDWPDVSGGGIGHFDKKGFNRDLDHALNP